MSKVFTKREQELIAENLKAFINNFGEPTITKEDYGKGFYVFRPGDEVGSNWVQFCYDIDYLNGWLYGCVQGINRCIKPIEKGE